VSFSCQFRRNLKSEKREFAVLACSCLQVEVFVVLRDLIKVYPQQHGVCQAGCATGLAGGDHLRIPIVIDGRGGGVC
jgi:hypothetical protein